MDTLHKSGYSIESSLSSLVPASGPVLCRDEMEEWSASEANLFEEALDKYGKDFADIRQDFVSNGLTKNLFAPKTKINRVNSCGLLPKHATRNFDFIHGSRARGSVTMRRRSGPRLRPTYSRTIDKYDIVFADIRHDFVTV